jgi:hypothetical protein
MAGKEQQSGVADVQMQRYLLGGTDRRIRPTADMKRMEGAVFLLDAIWGVGHGSFQNKTTSTIW